MQQCVKERCKLKINGEKLHLIEETTKRVNMPMHNVEPEESVWAFSRKYSNALRTAGYGNVHSSQLHIAFTDILKRLRPH